MSQKPPAAQPLGSGGDCSRSRVCHTQAVLLPSFFLAAVIAFTEPCLIFQCNVSLDHASLHSFRHEAAAPSRARLPEERLR